MTRLSRSSRVPILSVMVTPSGKAAELYPRADLAASAEDRDSCLADIQAALERSRDSLERGWLFMCRARVHINQWRTREVLDDALEALALFEDGGHAEAALDATSLAAAFASQLGELSLAAELATKAIVGLDPVDDDELTGVVANRLAMFCHAFRDYDRAVQQLEVSVAANEACHNAPKAHQQLLNVADVLLLAVRARRPLGVNGQATMDPKDRARLEHAGQVLRRVATEAPPELQRRFGSHRLQAEWLLEDGRPAEAMELILAASSGAGAVLDSQRAAFELVASRCLRALGRSRDALDAAERAVLIATNSGDDHELMLALEERLAARQASGDLEGALADASEVNWRMARLHDRQTAQVVEQVWVRASLERDRRRLEESTAVAVRSAEQDALTGIGNRRLLERFLASADLSPTLALVLVDIDHFKDINDVFGHELGDLVLQAVAGLLSAEARPGQVVVRHGGDEFVFVMPGGDLAAAKGFADRARLRVANHPWAQLDLRLQVTISLGVSSGAPEGWRSVLAFADRALYTAKRLGRNRVEASEHASQQNAS